MMKLSTSLVEDHIMKPPLASLKMLVSPATWNVIFGTKNKFLLARKSIIELAGTICDPGFY